MMDNPEAQLPPTGISHIDDSVLKKRGRFRRVNSDPIPPTFVAMQNDMIEPGVVVDSTTAELLCCLATSSSTSVDFDGLGSESNVKSGKARRLKSLSKDDSEMNLQSCSQDTFVGRYLGLDKMAGATHKKNNLSVDDYLLTLLPSISVDTLDGSKDYFGSKEMFGSKEFPGLRRELSELSDTADLLRGLSGSYDFTRSRGLSDIMPPPLQLPGQTGSGSFALDSARNSANPGTGDGIAYAFPDTMLPRRALIKKSPSLFSSPARGVNNLAKSASLNNAANNERLRKLAKDNSLTSAALNEFGMMQVGPNQPEDIVANRSVSDISEIPSGSLGSISVAGSGNNSGSGSSGSGGSGGKITSPTVQQTQLPTISQSLSLIDSASGDPSAFDALLQQYRHQNESQNLASSSWSINSGISSMSIGDLSMSTDHFTSNQNSNNSSNNNSATKSSRPKNYPAIHLLSAPSMDETNVDYTPSHGSALHNSHAAAHGGNHNVNSHIVHHQAKESRPSPTSKQRSKASSNTIKISPEKSDAVTEPMNVDMSTSISVGQFAPQTTMNVASSMQQQQGVPINTMGNNTFYPPMLQNPSTLGGFHSAPGYDSSLMPPNIMIPTSNSSNNSMACLPCMPPSPTYSYSADNTPRNFMSSTMYQGSSIGDDSSMAMSYSHSSSTGSDFNYNPSSYTSNFNQPFQINSTNSSGYFSNNSLSQTSFTSGPIGGFNNQYSMSSSNTLNYLAEIKGEANLFKEKSKSQRYSGRSGYRCGKCGQPKVNHVCEIVDTLITGQMTQTSHPILDQNKKPFTGDRVLTISKRTNITDEFDYDEHHNRYNLTQPRRDIFAKKAAQAQMQQQMQEMQAFLQMYSSMDGFSPTNVYTQQQFAMYQELLARTRSSSLYTSSYSNHSTPSTSTNVTPTAAAAVAKMSLNK